tara:strand:- start:26268 stop:26507 length:240 start_codon:yes stop_codon:yes gene_type:complete
MIELTNQDVGQVTGGSVSGVLVYGTIGFWVGGISGFCIGVLPTIPGALIGMTIGAYLGTDKEQKVIIIREGAEISANYE